MVFVGLGGFERGGSTNQLVGPFGLVRAVVDLIVGLSRVRIIWEGLIWAHGSWWVAFLPSNQPIVKVGSGMLCVCVCV